MSGIGKIYRDRKQISGCPVLEGGVKGKRCQTNGNRVVFEGGENVLKLTVVMVAQLWNILKPLNYILQIGELYST